MIIYSYLVFVFLQGLVDGRFLYQSQNITIKGYAPATSNHAAGAYPFIVILLASGT